MTWLASKRIQHWDAVSRTRALTDLESRELERAIHIEQRNMVRAQASAPPTRKGKSA